MVTLQQSVVVPPAVKPLLLYVPASCVFSLNVVAPVVLTPTEDEVPNTSVVKLVSGVMLPTSALKFVGPVVFTASVCAPLTVPLKLIAAPPVLARVVPAPSVTASL